MTLLERYDAWLKASRHSPEKWRVDPTHEGRTDLRVLQENRYVHLENRTLSLGTFNGDNFKALWTRTFETHAEAVLVATSPDTIRMLMLSPHDRMPATKTVPAGTHAFQRGWKAQKASACADSPWPKNASATADWDRGWFEATLHRSK